ncbi:FtsB family cell division protein [Salidesulfovibrio brasiliensis]
MKSLARNVVIAVLVAVNVLLLARLLFSDQSMFAYSRLKERHEDLSRRLEEAEERNVELSREIKRLKSDRKYQEKVVRERLNFVREDEILYVFPEDGQTGGEANNESEN